MKSRLQALLQDIHLPDGRTGGAFDWDQIMIVENIGRVPAPVSIAGDFLWNRGFKVLLLDRAGVPVYICKCRAPSDVWLRRETEIRALLCADLRLKYVIPWTSGIRTDEIQLQISRYVDGSLYDTLVPTLSLAGWVASIRSILQGANLACTTYEELSDTEYGKTLHTLDVAEPFLKDLASAGVSRSALEPIEDCLRRTTPVRAMVQHGDLWPRNIIHDGESWWLLDFEYLGETRVPLYDVYQLLRTCVLLRHRQPSGAEPTWFDCMSSGDPLALSTRELVRSAAASLGVQADQAMGCLACYLVEITGRLLRRRAPAKFCRSFVTELEHVGTAIKKGVDLEAVFWGN